jgi:hypothetical protein
LNKASYKINRSLNDITKVKWILFVCLIVIPGSRTFADQPSTVTVWITSGDHSRLFEKEIKSMDTRVGGKLGNAIGYLIVEIYENGAARTHQNVPESDEVLHIEPVDMVTIGGAIRLRLKI